MVILPISPTMIAQAQAMAAAIPMLKNSITAGEGRLAGCLGELAFCQHYPDAILSNTFDHDVLLRGKRIEVKTQRTTTSKIYPDYSFNVSAHNPNQDADFYFFTRIYYERETPVAAYLCGYLSKQEFLSKRIFHPAGEVHPFTGFVFRSDTFTVSMKDVNEINVTRF